MILQREIIEKAQEWGVVADTVDKDYVLSHFLNCFFNYKDNRELFVFKGGTCLRKCYFPDYRFSEDLDFTLKDPSFTLDKKFIVEIIQKCSSYSGIQFNLVKFEKKKFQDEDKGYSCIVSFWGANHGRNKHPAPKERWLTKIELDFSSDEVILFPIKELEIIHPYSDNSLINNVLIPAYSLEEILVEKIRSFYQRSYKAPRDFYDVWYLLNNFEFTDWNQISLILQQKCNIKNKSINTYLFENEAIYQTILKSWNQSIAHHLTNKSLPDFKDVWEYLRLNLFNSFIKI